MAVEDTDLHDFLLHNIDGIQIHRNCQKQIYNFLRAFKGNSKPVKKCKKIRTRNDDGAFSWHQDCMYSRQPCEIDKNHPNRNIIHEVKELQTKDMAKLGSTVDRGRGKSR